jgi:ABC-type transport system substrate-binding protein
MLVASLLLLAATLPRPLMGAAEGPREDDLVIQFYSNLTTAFAALKTGDIDLVLGSLTKDLTTLASQDANLVLAPVASYDMYEFDLNNNWSITDYPGIRSPMNYTAMRQAITWLTDKNYIVDVICEGFAERIDQMIAAPLKGWANTSMWYPNYPYEYDPLAAKAVLDSTFPEGTAPNPHYDPNFPGAAQYIRTYPTDHSLAGQNLDPLKICVRIDDPKRLEAGRMVYGNMRKHGIPCDVQESPALVLYPLVMDDMNYHFYTGSWSVGQFPPPSLYGLYHSINARPGGNNYVTGGRFPFVGDNATDPRLYRTHPKLDALLTEGNYATSHSQAVTACRKAAGYMAEECVTIPLFSRRSYYCYSNKLLGVVNQEGQGPENAYTFMNAYKTDGSPIRCATISPPHSMHIIYSSWEADWQCLDRMKKRRLFRQASQRRPRQKRQRHSLLHQRLVPLSNAAEFVPRTPPHRHHRPLRHRGLLRIYTA